MRYSGIVIERVTESAMVNVTQHDMLTAEWSPSWPNVTKIPVFG